MQGRVIGIDLRSEICTWRGHARPEWYRAGRARRSDEKSLLCTVDECWKDLRRIGDPPRAIAKRSTGMTKEEGKARMEPSVPVSRRVGAWIEAEASVLPCRDASSIRARRR